MERLMEETMPRERDGNSGHRVEQFVSSVRAQASTLKTKSFEDLWHGGVEYLRSNPGKTILVSVSAGFVLGALLRRR